MIAWIVTRFLASSYGLLDDLLEVLPAVISENLLKVPGQPKLDPALLFPMHQLLKAGV